MMVQIESTRLCRFVQKKAPQQKQKHKSINHTTLKPLHLFFHHVQGQQKHERGPNQWGAPIIAIFGNIASEMSFISKFNWGKHRFWGFWGPKIWESFRICTFAPTSPYHHLHHLPSEISFWCSKYFCCNKSVACTSSSALTSSMWRWTRHHSTRLVAKRPNTPIEAMGFRRKMNGYQPPRVAAQWCTDRMVQLHKL